MVVAEPAARWRLIVSVAAIALHAGAGYAHAQCRDTIVSSGRAPMVALPILGGPEDDVRRMRQALGQCSSAGQLIRSTSSLAPALAAPTRWALVAPRVQTTWNSQLPNSMNDGAEWAGRGFTSTTTAGARGHWGRVSVQLAPQWIFEQNRPFLVFASGDSTKNPFASPWHSAIPSADLPLRFGNASTQVFTLGESVVEVNGGAVTFGASTESLWWGPGVRNALLMSNNAGGIPQVFVRTSHPISTPIGEIEGRLLIGGLTESLYFDRADTNNLRSLNAFVVTLRTPFDTGLTVGFARSVFANVSSIGDLPAHLVDAFIRWNAVNDTAFAEPRRDNDQIFSLFGRWIFPESGFELYAEWAKLFPTGFRGLLARPQRGQGYTFGAQWTKRLASPSLFRFETEFTMLEQTPLRRGAVTPSFYTSFFVPQGYTQRGQSIGAAIGPGASSQWLAGDYFKKSTRLGLYLGRIRWEDEAYYRQLSSIGFFAHDVSLFAGLRGGATWRGLDVTLELERTARLNYLFQTSNGGYAADRTFDIKNNTLRLSVTPAAQR